MASALILSGGGAKGAFSVGALTYMMKDRNDFSFDIISGTSTGALIASLVCVGQIDLLRQIYTEVNNDDIIRQMDPVKVFRNKQLFFYNDAPLVTIINKHITEDVFKQISNSDKILFLTAVSLQSGKITVFSNKQFPSTELYDVIKITSRSMLIAALRASSNQAAFLPPIIMKGNDNKDNHFIDGGCREVIPCMAVMDQNPNTIYVVSNNPKFIFPAKDPKSVLDVLMRVIGILIQDVRENDIATLEKWRSSQGRNVDITYVEPDEDLDPEFTTGLRFEPALMEAMMGKGRLKAKTVFESQGSSGRILARTSPADPSISGTTSTRSKKCTAITQQGTRCKNNALDGSDFCQVHA